MLGKYNGFGVLIFCAAISAAAIAQPQMSSPEAEQARQERLQWWEDARFGMFIHWGLYGIPEGVWKGDVAEGYGEWIMYHAQIPVKEYEQLAEQFNPVKFNAEHWAKLAKDAGMKYMVITSKHHDGFAMFDSAASEYDIIDATPFDRDPIRELSEACKKYGIKFGVYYSVDRDWHHPHAQGNELRQSNYWDYPDESAKDFEKYLNEKALPQIRELLTQYEPAIIWFDGIGKKSAEQNERIIETVRELQPDCLINSRLGDWKSYEWGDYRSMNDNEVSDELLPYGWENPGTLGESYSYKRTDTEWKTPTEAIRMLADIASKGGNYLLNIGPKADGTVPLEAVRTLQEMGKWLDTFGESIYATDGVAGGQFDWGCLTARPGKLYVHIFEWPKQERLHIQRIPQKINNAYLLADPRKTPLEFEQKGENLTLGLPAIALPAKALNAHDTVVVLTFD